MNPNSGGSCWYLELYSHGLLLVGALIWGYVP